MFRKRIPSWVLFVLSIASLVAFEYFRPQHNLDYSLLMWLYVIAAVRLWGGGFFALIQEVYVHFHEEDHSLRYRYVALASLTLCILPTGWLFASVF